MKATVLDTYDTIFGEINERMDERRRIDHVTLMRGRRLLPALQRHVGVELGKLSHFVTDIEICLSLRNDQD